MEQNEKPMLSVKKHINELKSVAAVIADEDLSTQLIVKYAEMYNEPIAAARRFHQMEQDNFGKLISQSPELQQCTKMSAFLAFGFVMKYKASFGGGRTKLAYLIPGRRNIGSKEKPNYIWEMQAQLTADGEREVRVTTGILKKVGHPVIVHKGDLYKKKLDNTTGQIVVQWEEAENPSTEIVGGFIRLVEPDDTVVYKTFTTSDIEMWKAASNKKNWNKGANPLYESGPNKQIQESFFKTKILLHCFKGYKEIDYGMDREGFVPDIEAAKAINQNFTDEEYTSFEPVETKQAIEQSADDFSQAVNEPEPEQTSVNVKVEDDDDPFK